MSFPICSTSQRRESAVTWGQMQDLAKEMEKIRASISRQQLSLQEIEEWIEIHQPDHYASLVDDAPAYIPHLLEHLAAEERDGYETVRKGKNAIRRHEQATALSVWKDSVDLDMLSALARPQKAKAAPEISAQKVSKASKIAKAAKPSKVESANPFDYLVESDASDDDASDEETPVASRWAWMSALSQASYIPPAVLPPQRPTAPSIATSPALTAKIMGGPDVYSSAFSSSLSFVAAFGPIPRIQTSRKTIETLEGEPLWSMSKDERKRLFAYWHDRASEEGTERQFAKLDRARKDHEKAREENDQLRTQVNPGFFFRVLASRIDKRADHPCRTASSSLKRIDFPCCPAARSLHAPLPGQPKWLH